MHGCHSIHIWSSEKRMMQEIVKGRITDMDRNGVSIRTDTPVHLADRQYADVLVEFIDGRHITAEQRKKAWAIMTDVANWAGEDKETLYTAFKHKFTRDHVEGLKRDLFRLSTATVTEARGFINYLIDFCLDYQVPLSQPLYQNADDIEYYVRQCLLHQSCAICGRKADLHHVDHVGSHGGNRKTINHIGLRAMPLCREHHKECHRIGQKTFEEKYHLQGIPIDKEIATKYKLNTKARKSE